VPDRFPPFFLMKNRFPLAALNPRHGLTMAQRLGMIAEWRLAGRELPKIQIKPKASFRLVSMGGKNHLSLLRESLHSFARNASEIPPLTIISDGSLNPRDFIAALSFWHATIEVLMPSEVINSIPLEILTHLDPLVQANPLGLKLAGVIALSARGPMFFSDSDILWFADPVPLISKSINDFKIAVPQEEGASVNIELARKYAPELLNAPSVNSGCILTNYDLSTEPLLPELLEEAEKNSDNEFNEQTIFGILSSLRGGGLPKELCLTSFTDAFHINRRKPWKQGFASRHYVRFMRHQFYRDILKA
jgi:hypothetical protein